jgi:hypothetical protein
LTSKRRSCQASSHQGCRVAPRGTTVFRLFKASPIPHGLNFDTYQFRIMSAVVETSSPHLRVSAAKTSDQTQPESTRIQAPDALVDDHFFWTYTEEPHRSRRQAIIKAHPEVRDPVLLALMVVRGFDEDSMRSSRIHLATLLGDGQPQRMQLQC